jgi:hypothetical protein
LLSNLWGVLVCFTVVCFSALIAIYTPLLAAYLPFNSTIFKFFSQTPIIFIACIFIFESIYLFSTIPKYPHFYGFFRLPGGYDWLFLLPGLVITGLLGGIWFPDFAAYLSGNPNLQIMIYTIMFSLVAEIFFRSIIHGIFSIDNINQYVGGKWFLSAPIIISAFLYAGAQVLIYDIFITSPLSQSFKFFSLLPWDSLEMVFIFLMALIYGLLAGMVRERSQSIIPPLLVHIGLALITYFII